MKHWVNLDILRKYKCTSFEEVRVLPRRIQEKKKKKVFVLTVTGLTSC